MYYILSKLLERKMFSKSHGLLQIVVMHEIILRKHRDYIENMVMIFLKRISMKKKEFSLKQWSMQKSFTDKKRKVVYSEMS